MKAGASTVLLLAAALLPLGCGGSSRTPPAPPPIDLSIAPRSPTFPAGDPVVLDLTMRNDSGGPLAVSTLAEATIEIVSLTLDGVPVVPATMEIRTEEGLGTQLAGSLVTLAPGASTTATWSSDFLGPARGQVLSTYSADAAGIPSITERSVEGAGTYALEIRYDYPGPVPPGVPVFGGTATASTTFAVAP